MEFTEARSAKIRKHIIPLPVPEFGTIFHDVKLSTDCLETEKLSKPEEFNGVICHYRVNAITRTDNDKYCERSVYIEGGTRIGKQNAEDFKSLMERIYREEQQKLNQQFDEQTKPKRLITERLWGMVHLLPLNLDQLTITAIVKKLQQLYFEKII